MKLGEEHMTKDEALKLALEAFDSMIGRKPERVEQAITAIKEALAQPEQEPVAWMNDSTPSGIFARHMEGAKNFGCTIPLYTTPPQRTWVGLTDEDELDWDGGDLKSLVKAIEAKLKEKNNA